MPRRNKGFSRRTMSLGILLLIAILIGTLIAYGQISILYVLGTLSRVELLVIVGHADLANVDRGETREAETGNYCSEVSGVSSQVPSLPRWRRPLWRRVPRWSAYQQKLVRRRSCGETRRSI